MEIAVTLVVLGLAAALVAPAFREPSPRADDRASLIAAARESAVRRGQTLVLRIEAGGAWQLAGADDLEPLRRGSLPESSPGRLRFTPLGACFIEQGGDQLPADLSSCQPTPAERP